MPAFPRSLPPAARPDFWAGGGLHIACAAMTEETDSLARFAGGSAATRDLLFFQTSGSEGFPKWVGLTRSAMLVSAHAVNGHLEASAKDCWLIALPLHHVAGFSILARCHASEARWLQMPGRWDALAFAELCELESVTLTSLVPAQVHDLVKSRIPAPSPLRAVVVGGGGLNRELGVKALELGWPLLQSYGMTETASQVATEPLAHLQAGFDPDCLEVLPCWELSTDPEDRLLVQGAALASGYACLKEGGWTWQPLGPDGRLTTRDRVQLWQHGTRRFLRFLGREAAFVKVLGELVSLPALQARLEALCLEQGLPPLSFVIWSRPDARKDSRLVLVGEAGNDTLERLRTRFNQGVPGYQRLDEIRAVDAIPRSALGKVDRSGMEALW